ncbi:MAG: DNA polymerase IV [Bacteroidia bacterium]
METTRSIVHMDLDAFFVSVERRQDSRLQNTPLIIGGTSDRGVVSSCSYEARRFGVRAGMPVHMAKKLCPYAVVLKGDYDAYEKCSREITELIQEESPLFEKASIDEFYIDLTGMERFYGCFKWAHALRMRIMKETHLPLSMGLSVNKLVSKIVTNHAKPNGEQYLLSKQVEPFLSPLHVGKIPQIGEKTSHRLCYRGVRDIATLRLIPQNILTGVFGKQGHFLYESARGHDDRPVIPWRERKSISTESTFPEDTMDVAFLRKTLVQMTEKLAFQLREARLLTTCITVRLRYANFETVTKQATISHAYTDDLLIPKALALLDQLYQKRLRVRLVGVKLSHLAPGGQQIQLFQDIPRQSDLYTALDHIRRKYGTKSIQLGIGV